MLSMTLLRTSFRDYRSSTSHGRNPTWKHERVTWWLKRSGICESLLTYNFIQQQSLAVSIPSRCHLGICFGFVLKVRKGTDRRLVCSLFLETRPNYSTHPHDDCERFFRFIFKRDTLGIRMQISVDVTEAHKRRI